MRSPSRITTLVAASLVAGSFLIGCSTSGGSDSILNQKTTTTAAKADTTTTEAEKTTTTEADETTTTEADETTTTEDSTDTTLGDDATEAQVVDALGDELLKSGDLGTDATATKCVAQKMVDIVGVDKLKELNDLNTLDSATALELAQTWVPCGIDIKGMFEKQMQTSGMTSAQASCITDKIDEDLIEKMLAAGMSGGDVNDFTSEIQSAALACQ